MIPNQLVEVTITRNIQVDHFSKLGYDVTHVMPKGNKQMLRVPPWHLQKFSNIFVITVCDECGVNRKTPYKYAGSICRPCASKKAMKIAQPYSIKYGEEHHNWISDKSVYTAYSRRVRGLTKTTYDKCSEEINPLNFPRRTNGVSGGHQLDHIISIKRGFEEGISPEILAHKSNLRMITWEQNLERRRLDRNINKEQASSKER